MTLCWRTFFIHNNTNGFQVINMSSELPIRIKPMSYYNVTLFVEDDILYRVECHIVYSPYMINPNIDAYSVLYRYINRERFILEYTYSLYNISVVKTIDLIKYVKEYLREKYFRNYYLFQNYLTLSRIEIYPYYRNNTVIVDLKEIHIYNPGNDPFVFIGYEAILKMIFKSKGWGATANETGLFVRVVKKTKKIVIPPQRKPYKTIHLKIIINLTKYGINLTELRKQYDMYFDCEVFLIPDDNFNIVFRIVGHSEYVDWTSFQEGGLDG